MVHTPLSTCGVGAANDSRPDVVLKKLFTVDLIYVEAADNLLDILLDIFEDDVPVDDIPADDIPVDVLPNILSTL